MINLFYRMLVCLSRGNGISRLAYPWALALRRVVLICSDPLLRYRFGQVPIWIPLSSNLGLYRAQCPLFSSAVSRIAQGLNAKYPGLKVIDVGANVGDTVASIRNHLDCPVLAVEPNPRYFSVLEANARTLGNVTAVRTFIGDRDEAVVGRLQSGAGTARAVLDGDRAGSLHSVRLDTLLRDHPTFQDAKLLKIDTDGFDGRVLRGAVDWLSAMKPVVLFEYSPRHLTQYGDAPLDVMDTLWRAGYRFALVYENTGDFLLGLRIEDRELLMDLGAFFTGSRPGRYGDICAFHSTDEDMWRQFRAAERRMLETVGSNRVREGTPVGSTLSERRNDSGEEI